MDGRTLAVIMWVCLETGCIGGVLATLLSLFIPIIYRNKKLKKKITTWGGDEGRYN